MVFDVREAGEADHGFVLRLVGESALFGIPYGRTISNAEIRVAAEAQVRQLLKNASVKILVACRRLSTELLGYLILDLSPEGGPGQRRQGLILDVSVLSEYRGTSVVRCLIQEARVLAKQADLSGIAGTVSSHNRRAYLRALRLGFEVESYQLVMACSADGPVTMPVRRGSEKLYAVEREYRVSQRKKRSL